MQTITHFKGDTTVPIEVERPIVLSAAYIDHLLTIDEVPLAVNTEPRYGADYPEYLAEYLNDVQLIGSAEEPSLEKISELDPDVIFVESRTSDQHYDQLTKIAPTIVLGNEWLEYEDDPNFWTKDLLKVAEVFNKVELAEEKIEELKIRTTEVEQKVEELEHKKLGYLRIRDSLMQVYAKGGHPMNTMLYEELGFAPTDLTPDLERADYSLELIPILDADYLVLDVDPGASDTLETIYESNMWQQISAVEEQNVWESDSYWLFKGWGFIGRNQILDDIEELIKSE